MPEKTAIEQLKEQAANIKGFGEDGDDDLPEGKTDPDLEDEIPESGEPGEKDEEVEETPEGNEDPEDAAAKASAAEETELLVGEKFTKNGKAEFISKASFLKRLKKETTSKKEIEAKLKAYTDKATEYGHWDQYSKAYRESADYVNRLRPVFQAKPWLAQLIGDSLQGKPEDWKSITNTLKPFLAPFWDGAEDAIQLDPAVKALQEAEALRKELKTYQETQSQAQQRQQQEQQSLQQRQQDQQTFAASEKSVWEKYPKYKTAHYRGILFDRAEVLQSQFPKGTLVDLKKVADALFGEFDKEATARAQASQRARDKARRAAGEGSGGLPGSPLPAEKDLEKPHDIQGVRDNVRSKVLAMFGKDKFSD